MELRSDIDVPYKQNHNVKLVNFGLYINVPMSFIPQPDQWVGFKTMVRYWAISWIPFYISLYQWVE